MKLSSSSSIMVDVALTFFAFFSSKYVGMYYLQDAFKKMSSCRWNCRWPENYVQFKGPSIEKRHISPRRNALQLHSFISMGGQDASCSCSYCVCVTPLVCRVNMNEMHGFYDK